MVSHGAIYIKNEEDTDSSHESGHNTLNSSITEESFDCVNADSEFYDDMPVFQKYMGSSGKPGWVLKNNLELIDNGSFKGGKWIGNGYYLTNSEKDAFMKQFFEI